MTKTGKRGRPRKEINPELVAEALSAQRSISLTKLALVMGISRPTLYKHLKAHGVMNKFARLSKSDLDALIKHFRDSKPDSGIRYLVGFLRRHGLRIQKRRIYSSIHRVDGLGRVLRRQKTVKRQKYEVSRPHALWHIDGHHKLILWGIVIHGSVDGYSRTVRRAICI
jgi:DNA-binding transcriptional ArsR family regulator